MLYVPRDNSLLPPLGTEARSTAAPGDFTQTRLEMSQNWASGNPFLFTSHAPGSQPKPGLSGGGGPSYSVGDKIQTASSPAPKPHESAQRRD